MTILSDIILAHGTLGQIVNVHVMLGAMQISVPLQIVPTWLLHKDDMQIQISFKSTKTTLHKTFMCLLEQNDTHNNILYMK